MSAETFSLHLAQRKQSTCHNAELERKSQHRRIDERGWSGGPGQR